MAAITEEMVECAYQMAKRVYAGQIGRTDARFEIHRQCGMDAGSAGDYISAFLYLMEGDKCYKRTINTFATEYYLKHIGIDYGRQAQIRAAGVVKEHVKYYKSVMSYQEKIDKIADKYLQESNITKEKELGLKIRTMYEMPGVNKATMIHLFGVIYADTIANNKVKVPDIVKEAGLPESYKTEISKGIKLARYVQLKEEYKDVFSGE